MEFFSEKKFQNKFSNFFLFPILRVDYDFIKKKGMKTQKRKKLEKIKKK